MLEKIEKLFRHHFSAYEKAIGTIPQSCCGGANIDVFSYDEIKDDFSTTLGIQQNGRVKSVDAVYFSSRTEELYLIEMKGFSRSGSATISACKRFIDRHIGPFKLPNKIIDSLFILSTIMGYYDVDKDCYQYFLDQNGFKIKTVLLSNFSNQEIVDLNLLSLDKQKISLTKRIDGEIGILNCTTFTSFISSLS